jgi:hypothetical protein
MKSSDLSSWDCNYDLVARTTLFSLYFAKRLNVLDSASPCPRSSPRAVPGEPASTRRRSAPVCDARGREPGSRGGRPVARPRSTPARAPSARPGLSFGNPAICLRAGEVAVIGALCQRGRRCHTRFLRRGSPVRTLSSGSDHWLDPAGAERAGAGTPGRGVAPPRRGARRRTPGLIGSHSALIDDPALLHHDLDGQG